MDFRLRAAAYKDEGHTFDELYEALKIPAQTYYNWKRRLESGYYEKTIVRTRKRKIAKDELKKAVEQKPDAYLRELAEKFDCSATAVSKALKKLNITRKKSASAITKNRKKSARIS